VFAGFRLLGDCLELFYLFFGAGQRFDWGLNGRGLAHHCNGFLSGFLAGGWRAGFLGLYSWFAGPTNSCFLLHPTCSIHMLHNSLIRKAKIGLDASPAFLCWIIGPSFPTIEVIIALHPLYELKVVLILGLGELLNLLMTHSILRHAA
jgi:hypothetical protein